MDPEIHEPELTTSALVPARPPRFGRVAGWLQRVTGRSISRSPELLPPDLNPRIDALQLALDAHREETHKRLEQSEGRTLHHVQQRFEALEAELGATLRRAVENEVGVATGSLRRWLVGAILLALLACGVAGFAVFWAFSRGPA